jgi:hypothetical protein
MPKLAASAHPTAESRDHPTRPACQRRPAAAAATALFEFSNTTEEHQFQQSDAASYRFWDTAAALIVVTILIPYINFVALEARLCPSMTPSTCRDNLSPAWHLHQLLRTFPCAASPAVRLAQAAWWLRHWGPATLALYWINGDLDGFVAVLFPVAALLWLFWTSGAAVRGYSRQRTLLMALWRVGRAVAGILPLVAYKVQRLPGWPAYTVEMHWGRSTMFGATRLLWHVHLMAVSDVVSACLLLASGQLCADSRSWLHLVF